MRQKPIVQPSETQQRARNMLDLMQHNASMNPDGFRKISAKNGSPRPMTVWDRLLFSAGIFDAIPRRQQSPRKTNRAKMHKVYLDRVRETNAKACRLPDFARARLYGELA